MVLSTRSASRIYNGARRYSGSFDSICMPLSSRLPRHIRRHVFSRYIETGHRQYSYTSSISSTDVAEQEDMKLFGVILISKNYI